MATFLMADGKFFEFSPMHLQYHHASGAYSEKNMPVVVVIQPLKNGKYETKPSLDPSGEQWVMRFEHQIHDTLETAKARALEVYPQYLALINKSNEEKLVDLCSKHDWFYYQSDDGRVYSRGHNERQRIYDLIRLCDQTEARTIWNSHCRTGEVFVGDLIKK